MDKEIINDFDQKEEDKQRVAHALVHNRRLLWDNCRTREQQKSFQDIVNAIDQVEVVKGPQGTLYGRAHMMNKISSLVGAGSICVDDEYDQYHINDVIAKAQQITGMGKLHLEASVPEATDFELEQLIADHIADYLDAYKAGQYFPETQEMQDQLELMKHVIANPDDLPAAGEAKRLIQQIGTAYLVATDGNSADRIMDKLKVYAGSKHPHLGNFSYQGDLPTGKMDATDKIFTAGKIYCPACAHGDIKPTDNYCKVCGAKIRPSFKQDV